MLDTGLVGSIVAEDEKNCRGHPLKFVVLFGDVSGVVVWASWFQVQGA